MLIWAARAAAEAVEMGSASEVLGEGGEQGPEQGWGPGAGAYGPQEFYLLFLDHNSHREVK